MVLAMAGGQAARWWVHPGGCGERMGHCMVPQWAHCPWTHKEGSQGGQQLPAGQLQAGLVCRLEVCHTK